MARYVQGTGARQMLPQRHEDEREKKKVQHKRRRNREKALQVDLPYIFMLSIAAVAALLICTQYLQIHASVSSRIHNIGQLEQELASLKVENDAAQTSIDTYIDLDHIYKVATEELGMVYAGKSQVILYNRTESEYMRQNEDIPTE